MVEGGVGGLVAVVDLVVMTTDEMAFPVEVIAIIIRTVGAAAVALQAPHTHPLMCKPLLMDMVTSQLLPLVGTDASASLLTSIFFRSTLYFGCI